MPFIAMIVIGAAAGFLATRIMKVESGIITTVSIGILGAVAGGLVLRALVSLLGLAAGFVGAVLGALALIWLWQRFGPRL
ncbi:MAG: GlsB/YeaQ/YmgE family stress response membrane protein [Paracoccaceae bacterium]